MRAIARSIFWWSITIIVLFVFDDMLYGPVFWAISGWSQLLATVSAFVFTISGEQWLIRQGIKVNPGKYANFFMKLLSLESKDTEIGRREDNLKAHASSFIGASLVATILGGTIPVLILNKRAVATRAQLLRFSWIPTGIYAIEFALLHGGYGIGAVIGPLVRHLVRG